ncbi:MAG TPA: DUF1592 domain-containing protein [Bryobacteraceae bacterium]|jgi:mono/diheme cytochrome c family protein
MKRFIYLSAFLVLTGTLAIFERDAVGQAPAAGAAAAGSTQLADMLDSYCVDCHSTTLKAGGLVLDKMNFQAIPDNADIWEKATRKLRGRLMPPPGNPQPSQKEIDAVVSYLETTLDKYPKGQRAGYVPIERLNRTEYAASVKALVDVDVKEKDVLPQDIQVGGFDNVAAALSISPAFIDQYVTAARRIAKRAVPDQRVTNVLYTVAANQNNQIPMPPGTHGGLRFKHNFPAEGEYRINILDLGVGLYTSNMENESTLVILIDGKSVFRKAIGGPGDLALAERKGPAGRDEIMQRFTKIPVQVKAGTHDVIITLVDRTHFESDENVGAGFAGQPGGFGQSVNRMARVGNIEILGPYNPRGIVRGPGRDLIFVCDPQKTGELPCAEQITETLARRAFRRPASADDVADLMRFYQAGRAEGGGFDQGVEQVVAAVLGSPEFLFRSIQGNKGANTATDFSLSDFELATRLSYFLWNTGPDDELYNLAAAGGLSKPGAVDKQVKRMLLDPKASSLVTSFAMKWLNIADLDSVKPDPEIFRGFNDQMRRDFSTEAEQFLTSILLEDHSVVDLLTANYTFLDERLAQHYGVPGVAGSQFRRVELTDKARWGILGKGAVLLKTSYGDRTSPVLRGAWVLDKLMGTPPSPPPPNVATNLDQSSSETPKTIRERLEQHRQKAICMQCHGVIDPVGLPLESFDAIGQFRTMDRQAGNAVINASTVMPNGTALNGPIELRQQLASHPATFAQAMTEKMLMYAVNRDLEAYDLPQVRAVVRAAAKDNYKFSSLILGIVNSDAFRKQGPLPKSVSNPGTAKPAAVR